MTARVRWRDYDRVIEGGVRLGKWHAGEVISAGNGSAVVLTYRRFVTVPLIQLELVVPAN